VLDNGEVDTETVAGFLRLYSKNGFKNNLSENAGIEIQNIIMLVVYIELVLYPYAQQQKNKKAFLWQDNYGLHKVKCLDKIYEECGIEVGYLPVNTTYMLQVLDLVVNGPLKACIRKHRAQSIVEYFADFKKLYDMELSKPEDDRKTPLWKPPKPELAQCIKNLIKLMSSIDIDGFCHEDFIKGVQRSFIDVGLAYKDGSKTFKEYSKTTKSGTMIIAPAGTQMKFEHDDDDNDCIFETNANEEEEEEEEIVNECV
jgi:hypothetical protein